MKYTAAHWGTYAVDDQNELVPFDDDPAPSRIGRGWVSAARNTDTRILAPVVRKGWLEGDVGVSRCNDTFIEISWDRAIELASSEIERVRTKHGNHAIYGGSYGWASAGRFHHAQSQLRRFLNLVGGCVTSNETYSHAAGEVLFPHVFGLSNRALQDQMTSLPLVAEHCELLVCFGGLSTRTTQIASSGTAKHELGGWLKEFAKKNVRIVSISPLRSDISDHDAEWFSIRPNTDTALMLALACEIVRNGDEATSFLERCTSGWADYKSYLTGAKDGIVKNADWAEGICDIPAETIRKLAKEISSKQTMISVAWSLQRADHGEQPLWAAINLAAIVGQIGQPGTGFSFGYGSMAAVGRPAKLINWPSVDQGTNPISESIPVARIADMLLNPGSNYKYNGEIKTYPNIKLIYWAGGNPFHHHQDLYRLEEAWAKPETIIVNEHSWTATARRSDIVLPSTTPLERTDIMMNRRDPTLIYMSQLFDPLGSAKNDFDIFSMLAARLGFEEHFSEGKNTTEWLQQLWANASECAIENEFALPSFDTFSQIGVFTVPKADEMRTGFQEFAADPKSHPLKTESGRITLSNSTIDAMKLDSCPGHPTWLTPVESLLTAKAKELHLISGQPDSRLHAQNDSGSESQLSKIKDREPAHIHPKTASLFGLDQGDVALVYNSRGACLVGIFFDNGVRQDCISIATGAWFDPQLIDGERVEVHGNPNVLTIDKGCSELAQGNIAHTAIVSIKKWTKPLPKLTVNHPPKILPSQ